MYWSRREIEDCLGAHCDCNTLHITVIAILSENRTNPEPSLTFSLDSFLNWIIPLDKAMQVQLTNEF